MQCARKFAAFTIQQIIPRQAWFFGNAKKRCKHRALFLWQTKLYIQFKRKPEAQSPLFRATDNNNTITTLSSTSWVPCKNLIFFAALNRHWLVPNGRIETKHVQWIMCEKMMVIKYERKQQLFASARTGYVKARTFDKLLFILGITL